LHVAQDFGTISSPIVLCNATTVGIAYDALISFGHKRDPDLPIDNAWPPIVIGIDDGYLNDLRQRRVTHDDVLQTIAQAGGSAVVCGSIGIGRGLCALGKKGGLGDASRSVKVGEQEYVLGVFLAANGGKKIDEQDNASAVSVMPSLVLIIATDVPLMPEQLRQLAEAAVQGVNDIVNVDATQQLALAFSTGNTIDGAFERRFRLFKERVPVAEQLPGIFAAASESARAALRRALESAEAVTGRRGRQATPLRRDEVEKLFSNL
jgi:D-aminopeptidase